VAATLVWDNNDFTEETFSGRGTTHNTNGIQRTSSYELPIDQQRSKLVKTRKRSVMKPVVDIAHYYSIKCVGPAKVSGQQLASKTVCRPFITLDTVFCLMKLPELCNEKLLGWTGFNTSLKSFADLPPISKIGYLPVIDSSPTDLSTVYTILLRSVTIADALHLTAIAVVCNQAIYSKAQQIRWQNVNFQGHLVLQLGDFHTTLSFLSTIGKRFQNSGFEDIVIEAGIVAPSSIDGVMSGHHYNRSMRAHKLLFEALHRLRWNKFMETKSEDECQKFMNILCNLKSVELGDAFCEFITDDGDIQAMLQSYESYVDQTRKVSPNSPTFDFWSSYIDMVELLLLFVRATRDGQWELHLAALDGMLPWFFAYDRINYARYLPAYFAEMKKLELTHPSVFESFINGDFSAQRQDRYAFSQVACDQLIEQTMNRDSKTKGGLIGITTSRNAVNRWLLAHHERAGISRACEIMAGAGVNFRVRKDLDKVRISRDEDCIAALSCTIASMVDPFSYDRDRLIKISSGLIVADDVRRCKHSRIASV
jgi:hypothetical protein